MSLQAISLQNFRKFKQLNLNFDRSVSILQAPNASGKTSVLEAIYLISRGESFRAESVEEMITLGQELARVKGKVTFDSLEHSLNTAEVLESLSGDQLMSKQRDDLFLEVNLTRGIYNGKKVQHRLFRVNDVKRLRKNFVGSFQAVLFRPENLRLIDGSPERRRQFLNSVLASCDSSYDLALSTYHNALIRRNRTLEKIRDEGASASTLSYWTQLVLEHGMRLQQKRRELIDFIGTVAFPEKLQVEYLPSLLTSDRLATYSEREVAAGHTLIGPHKDDFLVKFDAQSKLEKKEASWVSIASYGSRGQERLAVLWLKMCELSWVEAAKGEKAALLLDDILSELDQDHRQQVYSLFDGRQVIVSTTEEKFSDEIRSYVREQDCQVVKLE